LQFGNRYRLDVDMKVCFLRQKVATQLAPQGLGRDVVADLLGICSSGARDEILTAPLVTVGASELGDALEIGSH
jgi:hypothetical protein